MNFHLGGVPGGIGQALGLLRCPFLTSLIARHQMVPEDLLETRSIRRVLRQIPLVSLWDQTNSGELVSTVRSAMADRCQMIFATCDATPMGSVVGVHSRRC